MKPVHPSMTRSATPGSSSCTRRTRTRVSAWLTENGIPKSMRPPGDRESALTSNCARSSSRNTSRTRSRNTNPALVRMMPRPSRSKRRTPRSRSSERMWRLKAGCATWRRSAALVTLSSSLTSIKYCNCRKFIARRQTPKATGQAFVYAIISSHS